MKVLAILIVFLITLMNLSAHANEEKERMYLFQLLNQLNAMKPLVIAASKEQPKTERLPFHYLPCKGKHGKYQPGLINEIDHIEQEVRAKLNRAPSMRSLAFIKGDYVHSVRMK